MFEVFLSQKYHQLWTFRFSLPVISIDLVTLFSNRNAQKLENSVNLNEMWQFRGENREKTVSVSFWRFCDVEKSDFKVEVDDCGGPETKTLMKCDHLGVKIEKNDFFQFLTFFLDSCQNHQKSD